LADVNYLSGSVLTEIFIHLKVLKKGNDISVRILPLPERHNFAGRDLALFQLPFHPGHVRSAWGLLAVSATLAMFSASPPGMHHGQTEIIKEDESPGRRSTDRDPDLCG
jgi:hypothetical protein